MSRQTRLNASLRAYLRWPFIFLLLLIIMDIGIYGVNKKAGVVAALFSLLYFAAALIIYFLKKPRVSSDIVKYAASYGQVQKQLLKELAIPYGVLDAEGHLLWANDELADIIGNEKPAKSSITNVFPELLKEQFPKGQEDIRLHLIKEEKAYCVLLRRVVTPDFDDDGEWIYEEEDENQENVLIAMYLYDETEIIRLNQENNDQKMIVGLLYIDNYEEALESIDEVRRSLLIALVDRKINKYMQGIFAIIKKLEKDKYIFVFQKKYLLQLQNSRFSLLEEVRGVNIGNEMAVTISMGLGVNEVSYEKAYEYARAAIDLALGRGGDQAVIKEGEKILYYGGKSVSVEKSTRVKARVKAHALKEFVEAKDKVVIMGHSICDIDSFGSAVGVYRIAKTLNKKAHIVINDVTSSIRSMLNRFLNNPDYEEDMILNNEQAIAAVDVNTLVVIVDVNRPNYTECPKLLELAQTVVILDHHRQSGEPVDNAVLSYIEPYASSACEMVAEILQYIGEGLKLKQVEADAMYAGMMIDTNNFLTKTGVRTFEAAAYLRRNGADVTRIRKMFRTEMHEYMRKAESITSTEIFMECYAFAECSSKGVDSPTVLAAQVANELLNIDNTRASFVFTEYQDKIYISARSIDELNVQVVMERLGGGGHMSVAGAQLPGSTVEEAMERVKEVLRKMTEEGEV